MSNAARETQRGARPSAARLPTQARVRRTRRGPRDQARLDQARERALATYPQLPAVRGDLLAKLGRFDEARREFERAAARTRNERERALFLDRAAECATGK